MMHLQYKGKGILVFVYVVISLISLLLFTSFINEYCFDKKLPKEIFQVASGVAILISGLWTYKTADDFYLDKEGNKQYVYIEHKFMYLDMKIWAYIFWVIGGLTIIDGVFELIEKLS